VIGLTGTPLAIVVMLAALPVGSNALTPFPAGTVLGATRFPEIINRATSLTLLNHDAGAATQNAALDTTGAGDWLWSNALVRMLPDSAAISGAPRPAPVAETDEIERRTRPLSLYTQVVAAQKTVCRMRPVSVQNENGGGMTGEIQSETAGKLTLRIWGDTIQVSAPLGGNGWQPVAPDGVATFRVTVVDSPDGYRCPPRSRHLVSTTEFGNPGEAPKGKTTLQNGETRQQIVVADARGRLQIEFEGAACSLGIEPDTGGGTPIKRRAR